ncbi:hypothetical protein llap_21075 [Limosa lapponica baueri]|uniref:Uncharacterized protein n=1 Tax=Limosa lapponica baueri TaxID=1758121 RepID=A0A2I0T4A6_LIMLA|nr:hypothetical protein llap_21075 [Limosa lapponica baueri]
MTSGSSQTDSTKNTYKEGEEARCRAKNSTQHHPSGAPAPGSSSALGAAVRLHAKGRSATLKAFSFAKFKIRSLLSRVVLVASNTYQKIEVRNRPNAKGIHNRIVSVSSQLINRWERRLDHSAVSRALANEAD